MKKLIILTLFILGISSCVDVTKQQEHLQSIYPDCIVEPATGIIQQQGYEFIVINKSNQIIAVSFYSWSTTKVARLRNIR